MNKIVLILDRYSDWLEAFSAIKNSSLNRIHIYFVENPRNSLESIKEVFKVFEESKYTFEYVSTTKKELFKYLKTGYTELLNEGDMFIAPFIRYKNYWDLIPKLQNVTTVHLSESLNDSFGHIGYRIGFRGRVLKTWLTLPFAKIYSLTHKPDHCYYPLYPEIKNTFVKNSHAVLKPELSDSKRLFIHSLTDDEKRPLLISGFGYDLNKMVRYLGLRRYIATSKNKEIIVDGNIIPLKEHICAEEVLLTGVVSEIIGYSSTAMVWAKKLYPAMPITCYKSSALSQQYGHLFNFFAKRGLKKINISLFSECKEMI